MSEQRGPNFTAGDCTCLNLSSRTVRPRPSGRGYQVHSAVLPNVVVMLDSKGRRTYPMRYFCAVTTEMN
jgi:hypothetical protein